MSQRIIYMDVLSFLSCIAVVYLHCSTVVFVNQGDLLWFLSIIVQSLFCFAVPVFFMISGANLIGYRVKYDTRTFLVRRVKRVAIPLVGFSLLYYLLACFAPGAFGLPPREFDFIAFVGSLLTNSICDVYWFLYSIIALYLITPLLSLAAKDKSLLRYLLCLSFISSAVIPLINRFAPIHTLLNLFVIPYLSGPIFYYLLGYYLERYVTIEKGARPIIAAAGMLVFAVMTIMTVKSNYPHTVASGSPSEFDNFYINIHNMFATVYSCALFCLAKGAEPRLQSMGLLQSNFFRALSSLPFYVYLIHMLIINTLDVYVPHSIVWDLGLRPPVVILCSLIFSYIFATIKRKARQVASMSAAA